MCYDGSGMARRPEFPAGVITPDGLNQSEGSLVALQSSYGTSQLPETRRQMTFARWSAACTESVQELMMPRKVSCRSPR